MLTIREPIKLNNRDIATQGGEGFFHRITDNYSLMEAEISSQDLIDAIMLPPEIYYQEGEQVSILNQNTNYIKNQQEKIEIINRLINRLTVTAYSDLTYQDKVYISSIVRKLGIKNEQEFMKRIENITQNIDNTHRELNFLEEATRILRESEAAEVQSKRDSVDRVILESIEKSGMINLHNQIFTRLGTEKVYEEFISYNNSLRRNEYITARTLQQTDFGKTVEFLKMQRLSERVLGQPISLSYRIDETLTEENVEELVTQNKEEMVDEISKVVLLSLFDEVYEGLKQEKYSASEYYYLHNELQGAVENTLNRFQQIFSSPTVNMIENAPIVNYAVHEVVSYPVTVEEEIEETVSTEEQILETLKRYDEKNLETMKIYQQALQKAEQRMKKPERAPRAAERMRRESLQALENPEEMLTLYKREEVSEGERELRLQSEIIKELPPDVQHYMELINRFFVNPGPEEQRILTSQDAMSSLMADINAAEMNLPENPYTLEEPDEQERVERMAEFQTIMDAITKIKQSEGDQETAQEYGDVTRNNINELIQTIDQVELNHRSLNEEEVTQSDSIKSSQEFQTLMSEITRIDKVKGERENVEELTEVTRQNIGELTEIVNRVEMEHPSEQEVEIPSPVIPKSTREELVDEVINRTVKKTSAVNEEDERHSRISMVHKSNETIDEEEILELIAEQRRMIEQNRTQIVENRETVNVINKNSTSTKIINENNMDEEKIYRIVQDSIAGSVGELSDKVFSRLERKLVNEKKRRGL